MVRHKPNRGLTMLETLIVIGIVVCLGVMVFPAIQEAREASRRIQCNNNMKRLGLAVHNYATAYKLLPPSSFVTRDADGKITAVDGWSWQALVLPYLERNERPSPDGTNRHETYQKLHASLDILGGRPLVEPAGAKGTPHADALATSLPGLLCPSFDGSAYTTMGGRKAAITNYRGSGATHIESLSVASPNPLTPKYNSSLRNAHPDSLLFPGNGLGFAAIRRGTSNTILAVESVEQNFSRWTVGADAAVVGLPRSVEFEKEGDGGYSWVPRGGGVEDATPVYWTYHTYLDTDCDKHPYDGLDGLHGGRFGPSSHHDGVVNHLFADGSCKALHTDIDVTLYMYLIKRDYR
jgi:type II secretory pathway pseudopilin PulG